jgi:hypothetical protein
MMYTSWPLGFVKNTAVLFEFGGLNAHSGRTASCA